MSRLKHGRTLMLGAALGKKVKQFLLKFRKKSDVVNTVVANATAKALIARSNDEHLQLIDLESTTLPKNLLRRIGYGKRAATTSKSEILELAKREGKLLLQHQVANLIEKYGVSQSTIMSFD